MNLIDVEVRKRKREQVKEKRERRMRISKLSVMGTVFTAILFMLLFRVSYIKAMHGDEYERIALNLQYRRNNAESVIMPNRGRIVDRNNQSLALSHSMYNVILDIRAIVEEPLEPREELVQALHEILGEPVYRLQQRLAIDLDTGKPVNDTRYYKLRENVSRAVRDEIMEANLKGVYFEMTTTRDYPHGNLASQIIGFMRGDRKWGLEAQYDVEMSGWAGRTVRYTDSRNNVVTEQRDPIDGYTLVTTIDTDIQKICEDAALSLAMQYQPQNALVAAMNPMTGEILGMAQYPTFDLNYPANMELFTNSHLIYDAMGELYNPDAEHDFDLRYGAWKNYGIANLFEPGSITKPMVVAAALEEGVISLNDRFYCGGIMQVLDEPLPCWVYQYGGSIHGEISLTEVLSKSCNIGMIEIANRMGREMFYKYQRDFGFGEQTGIDLPGETGSLAVLYPVSRLNPVELATGGFGQGFGATAIQSMNAFAATINGGDLMRPYVVSRVTDRNNAVVKENSPTVVRRVISRDTSNHVREAMHETFLPGGTAARAEIPGYAIGGKTGTAQQGVDRDELVLSVMGYLPNDNPEILVLVLIDRPLEYEDRVTSPVPTLQTVMLRIIQHKAIPPSESSAQTAALFRNNSVTMDNYIGSQLKDVAKNLNSRNIGFECIGNGDRITNQNPKPGIAVEPDSQVILYLGEFDPDLELVLLPDVRNAGIDVARNILTNAGFEVSLEIDDEPSASYESGGVLSVYSQMPSGGIRIEMGTEIRLKAR